MAHGYSLAEQTFSLANWRAGLSATDDDGMEIVLRTAKGGAVSLLVMLDNDHWIVDPESVLANLSLSSNEYRSGLQMAVCHPRSVVVGSRAVMLGWLEPGQPYARHDLSIQGSVTRISPVSRTGESKRVASGYEIDESSLSLANWMPGPNATQDDGMEVVLQVSDAETASLFVTRVKGRWVADSGSVRTSLSPGDIESREGLEVVVHDPSRVKPGFSAVQLVWLQSDKTRIEDEQHLYWSIVSIRPAKRPRKLG